MFRLPGSHRSTCGGSKQMTELYTTHSETCNFVLKLILMHLFTSLQVHSSAFPNTDTPLVCCSLMLLFFTYLLTFLLLYCVYFFILDWEESTRWPWWQGTTWRLSSRRQQRTSSSPDCTDREAAELRVRRSQSWRRDFKRRHFYRIGAWPVLYLHQSTFNQSASTLSRISND